MMPVIMIDYEYLHGLILASGGQQVADGAMKIGDIMALTEYAV